MTTPKTLWVTVYNDEVERLLQIIRGRWGQPHAEYMGPHMWRVCVNNKHLHHSCGYGSFCATGDDVIEAATRLIKNGKAAKVGDGYTCERSCSEYFDDGY